jgi:hypothetical protein
MPATETKVKKSKLTLSIAAALNQRLDFEAAIKGKGHDRSSIVEALISEHVKLPENVDQLLDSSPEMQEAQDAKTSGRQPTEAVTRGKTTFYFSPTAARRLRLHSLSTGQDCSSIVEGLIRDHVAPWKTYDESKMFVSARPRDRRRNEPQLNSPVSEAA